MFADQRQKLGRLRSVEAANVLVPDNYDVFSGKSASLKYKTKTVDFTVGATLTGGTSNTTGVIYAVADNGDGTGTLMLNGITGGTGFEDGEMITDDEDPQGSAKADGVIQAHSGSWCQVSIITTTVFVAGGVKVSGVAKENMGTHEFPALLQFVADFTALQMASGLIVAHKITGLWSDRSP